MNNIMEYLLGALILGIILGMICAIVFSVYTGTQNHMEKYKLCIERGMQYVEDNCLK